MGTRAGQFREPVRAWQPSISGREEYNLLTVAFEAHNAEKSHRRHYVVAVGRDYRDAAPMSGTYDGPGATNTLAVQKRLALR